MKTNTLLMLFTVLVSALPASAADHFKFLHVNDVAKLRKSSQLYIYDANTEDTRKKNGLVEGAVPLSSSKNYDVKKTLPADRSATLVFYCANEKCMASHAAANRAAEAGYTDVNVMPEGITGWKAAGQPTSPVH